MKIEMPISKSMVALEWSFSQKCFHIELVCESIKANYHCFLSGGGGDYVLMGVFGSDAEAMKAMNYMKTKRPDIFCKSI